MFLAHIIALRYPKFFCIKIVNSNMLFQNLLQKPWVTKGNDAQTAILGIELIPKKAFLLTYASLANFDSIYQKVLKYRSKNISIRHINSFLRPKVDLKRPYSYRICLKNSEKLLRSHKTGIIQKR